MDINTVAVVLILIVLFFGTIIWLEVHSRKTSSKGRLQDDIERNGDAGPALTVLTSLGLNGAASSKNRTQEK